MTREEKDQYIMKLKLEIGQLKLESNSIYPAMSKEENIQRQIKASELMHKKLDELRQLKIVQLKF